MAQAPVKIPGLKIDPKNPRADAANAAAAHLQAQGVDPAVIKAIIAKILAGIPTVVAIIQTFLLLFGKPTPPASK